MTSASGARVADHFRRVFGRGPDVVVERARPREPDRRAHRLQRRLRAADGDSAARPGSAACDIGRPSTRACQSGESRRATAGPRGSSSAAKCGRHAWLDYVQGCTQALAARRRHARRLRPGDLVGRAARQRPVVERRAGGRRPARAARRCSTLTLDDVPLAQLGQRAENDFVGAPVGIMDQMAASLADEHTALFLDTRSLAVRAGARCRPARSSS